MCVEIIDPLDAKVKALETVAGALQSRLDGLDEKIGAKTKAIEETRSSLVKEYDGKKIALDDRIRKKEDEFAKQQKTVESAKAEAESIRLQYQSKLESKSEHLDTLKNAVSICDKEHLPQIKDLREQVENLQNERDSLQKILDLSKANPDEAKLAIARLEGQKQGKESMAAKLAIEVSTRHNNEGLLRDRIEETSRAERKARDDFMNQTITLTRAQVENEHLQQKADIATAKVRDLELKNEALQSKIDEMHASYGDKIQEAREHQSEIDQAKSQNQVELLVSSLSETSQRMASTSAVVDELSIAGKDVISQMKQTISDGARHAREVDSNKFEALIDIDKAVKRAQIDTNNSMYQTFQETVAGIRDLQEQRETGTRLDAEVVRQILKHEINESFNGYLAGEPTRSTMTKPSEVLASKGERSLQEAVSHGDVGLQQGGQTSYIPNPLRDPNAPLLTVTEVSQVGGRFLTTPTTATLSGQATQSPDSNLALVTEKGRATEREQRPVPDRTVERKEPQGQQSSLSLESGSGLETSGVVFGTGTLTHHPFQSVRGEKGLKDQGRFSISADTNPYASWTSAIPPQFGTQSRDPPTNDIQGPDPWKLGFKQPEKPECQPIYDKIEKPGDWTKGEDKELRVRIDQYPTHWALNWDKLCNGAPGHKENEFITRDALHCLKRNWPQNAWQDYPVNTREDCPYHNGKFTTETTSCIQVQWADPSLDPVQYTNGSVDQEATKGAMTPEWRGKTVNGKRWKIVRVPPMILTHPAGLTRPTRPTITAQTFQNPLGEPKGPKGVEEGGEAEDGDRMEES